MELVNKILIYRPSHPIKALIDGMYDEIKKSELYKNKIGRFEKDREIILSSGDFEFWLWKSVVSRRRRTFIDLSPRDENSPHFRYYLTDPDSPLNIDIIKKMTGGYDIRYPSPSVWTGSRWYYE
jgi:hypothetical protein